MVAPNEVDDWQLSPRHEFVEPIMRRLAQRVPGFQSAMLCNTYGMNLCSVGVAKEQVSGRIAMITSLSMETQSVAAAFDHMQFSDVDVFTIASGELTLVGTPFVSDALGRATLVVAASSGALGGLVVAIRAAVRDLLAAQP